jgi:hypothetical protein
VPDYRAWYAKKDARILRAITARGKVFDVVDPDSEDSPRLRDDRQEHKSIQWESRV